MLKAALYLRVSTKEQTTDNQLPDLAKLAAGRGYDIGTVYRENETAWKRGHQHELDTLRVAAHRHEFDVLMIWDLDRLTRQGIAAILGIIAVCLYKVLQLSNKPKVSEIRVLRGWSSSIIGQYNLESCYAGLPIIENLKFATMSEEGRAVLERLTGKAVKEGVIGTVMEGYFTNPHFFSPQTVMNIQLKANYEDTPGDRLVLSGYIAEPRGMRIGA